MKEVNLTLYEVFGYLLPGAIATLGVTALFYVAAGQGKEIYIPEVTKTIAALAVALVYYSGHVVQALGNLIFGKRFNPEDCLLGEGKGALAKVLVDLIKSRTAKVFGIASNDLTPSLIYYLCDSYVVQHGNVGDREIFQYREGFYRGLCISCGLLLLASLVVTATAPITITWDNKFEIVLTKVMLIIFGILCGVGVRLFYLRFKRFAEHKVKLAVTTFLSITKE